jgi:hypothetical protein
MAETKQFFETQEAQDEREYEEALEAARKAPPNRRTGATSPFRRKSRKRPWVEPPFFAISYADLSKLRSSDASGSAYHLTAVLDFLMFGKDGEHPLHLTPVRLATSGIAKRTFWRALRQLETAGLVAVERGRGRCPILTSRWRIIPRV